MPYVTLPVSHQSVKLHYDLHGEGPNKVLFIMGLKTEGRAWKYQTDFFGNEAKYQCVTYDNRGCGRSSSPWSWDYTTVQMAKDALVLIDHLCWSKCHVVGISMGGMIALEFALLAPRRILSLTLMATHAGGLIGQAPFIGIYYVVLALFTTDQKKLVNDSIDLVYGRKTSTDPERRQMLFDYHFERLKTRVPLSMRGIFGHLFAVQRHYVSYADLLKIRYSNFPCLIMVGTEDRLVREVNSYVLRRTLGCRLVKLEHAGHDLAGECAEQVNKELLNLFESVDLTQQSTRIPDEYSAEIRAVELCCQHRSHCFIYNVVGLLKGMFLGFILYVALTSGLSKSEWMRNDLQTRCIVLIGSLSGFHRSFSCIFNAFRARRYVEKHRLLLGKAANHGGVGIDFLDQKKSGIPKKCGFEFPLLSILFTICLIVAVWWTRQYD